MIRVIAFLSMCTLMGCLGPVETEQPSTNYTIKRTGIVSVIKLKEDNLTCVLASGSGIWCHETKFDEVK